jgi:hypothetical protein
MGDNSFVEVTDKGRIELTNKSFENVLHVPKISVNLVSMYHMTNYGTRNKLLFTTNVFVMYDIQTNSRVATFEVNHQSRLYTFSEFIEPDFSLLLTHADESSRIWNERFGNLDFRYMKQLGKQILVYGLPKIHFSKGLCEGCVLGKHPQEKFNKGKSHRGYAPLDLLAQGQTQGSTLQKCTNKTLTTDPFRKSCKAGEVSPEVEAGGVTGLRCL